MVGRPSNRDERYEQVMKALVRCVAQFGLKGVTLSQIAKEADLTRPLIRHHIGNRDDMLSSLQNYVLSTFIEQTKALENALPEISSASFMIEILFDDLNNDDQVLILAFAALTASATENTETRVACRDTLLTYEDTIRAAVARQYPNAGSLNITQAALAITALHFNYISLSALEMPRDWKENTKQTAHKILMSLETEL